MFVMKIGRQGIFNVSRRKTKILPTGICFLSNHLTANQLQFINNNKLGLTYHQCFNQSHFTKGVDYRQHCYRECLIFR